MPLLEMGDEVRHRDLTTAASADDLERGLPHEAAARGIDALHETDVVGTEAEVVELARELLGMTASAGREAVAQGAPEAAPPRPPLAQRRRPQLGAGTRSPRDKLDARGADARLRHEPRHEHLSPARDLSRRLLSAGPGLRHRGGSGARPSAHSRRGVGGAGQIGPE